jgi:hypothetical protein
MTATSATRHLPANCALPVQNLWAAVAILLNTLTASATPTLKGAPVAPLPAAMHAPAPVADLRGPCDPVFPCGMDRTAGPARPWSIRTPSRTRSWRYRPVFA